MGSGQLKTFWLKMLQVARTKLKPCGLRTKKSLPETVTDGTGGILHAPGKRPHLAEEREGKCKNFRQEVVHRWSLTSQPAPASVDFLF